MFTSHIISIGLIAVSSTITIQERLESDSSISSEWEFLRAGMVANREKLVAGVYKASGTYISLDPQDKDLQGNVEIFSAFENSSNLLRFDRKWPVFTREFDERGNIVNKWTIGTSGGTYINNMKLKIEAGINPTSCEIDNPDAAPHNFSYPFDIRGIGIYYLPDFERGNCQDFQNYLGYYDKHLPVRITEVSPGLHQVEWVMKSMTTRESRRTLWIDEAKNFAPVKVTQSERRIEDNDPSWPRPILECDTTWISINDVWVPETLQMRSQVGEASKSLNLSFNWQSVNSPIPGRFFAIEGLGLPEGAPVIDSRLNPAIIIGHIDEYGRLSNKPLEHTVNRKKTGKILFIILMTFLPVIAILLVRHIRRRWLPQE